MRLLINLLSTFLYELISRVHTRALQGTDHGTSEVMWNLLFQKFVVFLHEHVGENCVVYSESSTHCVTTESRAQLPLI